jgi:hypothetical protein
MPIEALATAVFGLSPHVRYVALRIGDGLSLQQRSGLSDASSSNSDRYEELLVNPTLLLLTTARGQIDCGGLEYLLIRYGKFFQLVHPVRGATFPSQYRWPRSRSVCLPLFVTCCEPMPFFRSSSRSSR